MTVLPTLTPTSTPKTIGAVDRALAILELFNDQTPELGITEMSKLTGLHKSTLAGLVYTLEQRGYLFQNRETRKYRLGLRLAERAQVALTKFAVTEIARPHLIQLVQRHDESVNLAVLEKTEVVYIDHVGSSQPLGVRVKIGKRASIHTTALGKVITAFLPTEDRDLLVAQISTPALEKVTPNSIDTPERLLTELERIKAQGYSLDDQENELGGRCVAAPIFDWAGRVVAGVSLSAPIQRFPYEQVEAYGKSVRETAAAISQDMGYRA
jgi:DNA-binding IclR family transcriptional regulator